MMPSITALGRFAPRRKIIPVRRVKLHDGWYKRAGPIFAAAIAAVLAGTAPAGAEVVTTTKVTSYPVSGTTPLTILHSMLKRGRRIGHAGSMAITHARLRYDAELDRGPRCSIASSKVTANFTISLPRHTSEATLPARTKKAFRAFRKHARRHELYHRDVYLKCARRADRAIAGLGDAANCRTIIRAAKKVWDAEMDRCSALHAAYDARETARSAKVPLLREAMAALAAQRKRRAPRAKTQAGHAGGVWPRTEGIGR